MLPGIVGASSKVRYMDQFQSASGGVSAAAGLGYQYLATLEDALDWIRDHPGEDFAFESEDHLSDLVDYAIFNREGERAVSVQAKSSVDGPLGKPLGGPEIARILLQLISHEARQYVLRTNRPLSRTGQELAQLLSSPERDSIPDVMILHCAPEEFAEARAKGWDLSRLERCRVVSEAVNLDEVRERIAEKVRYLRRLGGHGAGQRSAEILVGHLVSQVLFLSSRRGNRRMDLAGMEELLGTASALLADAAGIVDWGVPRGPVPTTRIVDRVEALGQILETFSGPPVRDVRRLVLTGLSGIGKSTLCAMYLEHARHYYDRILWVDALNTESIRGAAAALLGASTKNIPTSQFAEQFKHAISTTPGTWLIVFDNAPDDRAIEPWLPVTGAVDLIATSTNSTGWSQWHRQTVPPLQELEALALVQERLELIEPDEYDTAQAVRLCDRLDFWPLAIELACAFLAGSDAGLDMTEVYLERLKEHIIDDDALVPAQYKSHPSLLQAILVALETITTGPARSGLAAMALLQTLSYLPPRSAPLQLAAAVTGNLEARNGTYQVAEASEDELQAQLEHDADVAVRRLLEASLTRRNRVPSSPWGDVLRTNEIILDVVRRRHNAEAQSNTLALLQGALYPQVKAIVDEYLFNGAEQLAACALTTIDFSEQYEVHTREGIALIGNLANVFSARDDPATAIHLFRRELALIDRLQISAPVIEAKVHTDIARLLHRTDASLAEIRHSVDRALYFLRVCVDEPDKRAEVHISAQGLYELIRLLCDADPREVAFRGQAAFLSCCYPELEESLVYYRFQNQLKNPANDDTATLEAIRERLEREEQAGARLQLLFLQADATAMLGRYRDSLAAFEEAIHYANARGIGLAAGWTEVLNAWETASFHQFRGTDAEPLRYFCRQMDELTRGQQPSQREDRVTLELCRIATQILDTPTLDESAARLDRVTAHPLTPTHQKKNVEVLQQILGACQEVVRVRRAHHGARILRVSECWGHSLWPERVAFVLAEEDLDGIAIQGTLNGTWVFDPQGTGLLLHLSSPILLWVTRQDTGWVSSKRSSPEPSEALLRRLAKTTLAVPGAEIVVGPPDAVRTGALTDPAKPTVTVRIR